MEQWALVLADSVLLVVALGGAVITLMRVRRVGGLAAVLAGAAAGVLVVAAIFDMIWWTQVYPGAFDGGDFATAATLGKIGTLGTMLLIAVGVALLIASTNVRQPAAAGSAVPPAPGPQPAFPMGAQMGAAPTPPVHQPAQPAQAQPAAGWTPPQQAQPRHQPAQPDWNIHSGVWSIPRGTFDRPPPDQHRPDQQQPR